MMKIKNKRLLSIFLVLCIMFSTLGPSDAVYGETIPADTYYVGGLGASDENNGTSSTEPFASISYASSMINSLGSGSYKIIVQGDITENKQVQIGDGKNQIQVAITNTVTGSAIVMRGPEVITDLIIVENNSTLTLGDKTGSTMKSFVLNGNSSDTARGSAVMVKSGANLEVYSNTEMINHINNNPLGFGGGIHNLGTVSLMGGSLNNNTAKYYGGAIYNKGTLFLRDGEIKYNDALRGGGIYNSGTIHMSGAIIDNNLSEIGGGIYNDKSLIMNGGSISNNKALNMQQSGAIYSIGTISLSGDAVIPWDNNYNSIYLNHEIQITDKLNNAVEIALFISAHIWGNPVLTGSVEAIASNHSLFTLLNSPYKIDDLGCLVEAESIHYYVGGDGADDNNDGTDSKFPLATLETAVSKANSKATNCIITLQSDITIRSTLYIYSNITIQSDNTARTVSPKGYWADPIFYIEKNKTLTLGDGTIENSLLIQGFNISIYSDFIINNGTLILRDGIKVENICMRSFVQNKGTLIIEGGLYQNNTFYSFIYNNENIRISGGNISNNNSPDDYGTSSIIENQYGTTQISGGTICNNNMCGIANNGKFSFTGGQISDNITDIKVFDNGSFTIAGAAETTSIHLQNYNSIQIEDDLTDELINVMLGSYSIGREILKSAPSILESNHTRFVVDNKNYIINQNGKLEYIGVSSPVYYVGGDSANDDNEGTTKEKPFLSLNKAVEVIGSDSATIVLQSDITIGETIYITGNNTIISDGTKRTIFRETWFYEEMFIVNGRLILGNSDFSKSDSSPDLILDGSKSTGPVKPMIVNYDDLYIYPGTLFQNINSTIPGSAMVNNGGYLHMYGGVIQNNTSDTNIIKNLNNATFIMTDGCINDNYAGNCSVNVTLGSSFLMEGGAITNNIGGYSSGVLISYESSFTMTGGIISGNINNYQDKKYSIDLGSGVNIENNSIFTMDGGEISNNSDNNAAGVIIVGSSFIMNNGAINDNTGSQYSGVYLGSGFGRDRAIDSSAAPSDFTMNGGYISGNKGSMVGISSFDASVTINEGIISNNTGTISGINSTNGNIIINGGTISENVAESFAGVLFEMAEENMTNMEGLVQFNGGEIKNNKALLNGICSASKIEMSGKNIVTGGDKVIFLIVPEVNTYIYGIKLKGEIASDSPDIPVAIYSIKRTGNKNNDFIPEIPLGKQLIYNDGAYDFTVEDLSKFKLASSNHSINYEGKIGTTIKDSWVNISEDKELCYDGKEKTLSFIVNDETTILTEDNDYSILYKNNINTGTAQLILLGKGKYAGIIHKDFTIKHSPSAPIYYSPVIPPIEEIAEEPENINVSVTEGTLTINVNRISEEETKDKLIFSVPSNELLEQITDDEVNDTNIIIKANESLLNKNDKEKKLLLKSEILVATKAAEKDLTVSVEDAEGRERFSWSFNSNDLNSSNENLTDVNLYLEVHEIESDDNNTQIEDSKGLIIDFSHEGKLPSQASIRIYVGDMKDVEPGNKIYLYHINKNTGMLESLPFSSSYKVDKDGYILINILHCSEYAILTKKSSNDILSSLRDQITISIDKGTIYIGGDVNQTALITVTLPPTLELVKSFKNNTSQSVIGGVTVSYSSSNENIATVDKNGIITPKKKGNVLIYATATLYSGKSKIIKFKVSVKEPYIELTKYKTSMKLEANYRFMAEAYGLDIDALVWTTKRRSKVVINKQTGLANAVSKGTDYIVATINDVSKEIKVVVK